MSRTRHFHKVGPLLLLTASVSVGRVAARDADKKILPTPTAAYSPRYVDLGKGWHPRYLASPRKGGVERELHRIILPKVELNGVPFDDAITYFQQAFRDHDPEHRGVSFFIKWPPSTPPYTDTPPPRPPMPRITLRLGEVRYSEALDKLASAAGMKWHISPYSIEFVPLSESTDPLYTAERAASLEAVGLPADTKGWLESKGVDFPPGTSAVYKPDTHRLVVRQTQANIEKIRLIVTSQ